MRRRPQHRNKDVEQAIRFAEAHQWVVKAGGHWGMLYCPYNDSTCRCGSRCIAGIWGTPKNPSHHAKQIREVVNGCTSRKKRQSAQN